VGLRKLALPRHELVIRRPTQWSMTQAKQTWF
jgi:hypothetical protein